MGEILLEGSHQKKLVSISAVPKPSVLGSVNSCEVSVQNVTNCPSGVHI